MLFGAFMYTYFGILQYERIVSWLDAEHIPSHAVGLLAAAGGVFTLFCLNRFYHLPSSWNGRKRLILFLILSTSVCVMTSPREEELLQMKMQRLLHLNKPAAALDASARYHAPTLQILHLRVEALSATGELCNDFFTYPLGNSMRGKEDTFEILGITDKAIPSDFHRKSLFFLLRRDLVALSRHLATAPHTQLQRAELEALVLYSHTHTTTTTIYRDQNIEANYRDFKSLESKYKNMPPVSRANLLGDTYGDTYWHYYYYGKH